MPEITDELRDCMNPKFVLYLSNNEKLKDEFIRDSIREHDEGQLPVDAELLDSLTPLDYSHSLIPGRKCRVWTFKNRVAVSWKEDGNMWNVAFCGHIVCLNPTCSDVLALLRLVGGGK